MSKKNKEDENDNVNASAPFSFFLLLLNVHFAQLSKHIVMEGKKERQKTYNH
jgi:hypothetical protein